MKFMIAAGEPLGHHCCALVLGCFEKDLSSPLVAGFDAAGRGHDTDAGAVRQPVGGNITRVLASDLSNLSSFLKSKFNYDTGPFENIPKEQGIRVMDAAREAGIDFLDDARYDDRTGRCSSRNPNRALTRS